MVFGSELRRATTGLLALIFAASTAMAGAALHLCGMEDLVLRTCCCHKADEGPPVQLKRIDDCCGALLSKAEHTPFVMRSDQGGVDAPMVSALTDATHESFGKRPEVAVRIPPAPGPPGVHDPPLYVWNCAYLI